MSITTIGVVLGLGSDMLGGAILGAARGQFHAHFTGADEARRGLAPAAKLGALLGLCLGIPF